MPSLRICATWSGCWSIGRRTSRSRWSTRVTGFFLKVTAARSDAGKVIGREGRTIQALRSLLTARARVDGERYDLDLLH